jgi:type VI secretion system protein VasD
MDLARRAFVGLFCTGAAGCTATRQTLADATGWVSKTLDPKPPPPPPAPATKLEAPPPPPKPVLVVPPRQMQLAIRAGDLINPDYLNRPSPVVVRVYLLRAEITFASADFFSLYERDAATLGADLLAREELQLRPGRVVSINREFPPEARFLGVVVAFRNVEKSTWRALSSLPIPPPATAKPPEQPIKVPVRIAIDGGDIAVSIG